MGGKGPGWGRKCSLAYFYFPLFILTIPFPRMHCAMVSITWADIRCSVEPVGSSRHPFCTNCEIFLLSSPSKADSLVDFECTHSCDYKTPEFSPKCSLENVMEELMEKCCKITFLHFKIYKWFGYTY